MRFPLAIPVLCLALILAPAAADACSCIGPFPPPLEALAEADAVFFGEVLDVTQPEGSFDVEATFLVHAVWKGPIQSTLTVRTPSTTAGCGFPFSEGQDYLVYAATHEVADLYTHICTRTVHSLQAASDLEALGPPPTVAVEASTWSAWKARWD